ncbi:hypothetical protein HAX54_031285 [Datura stramonium]|uniref:Uncharacterized protein n=1 Tax=Datura stramonium TaxID=4076 RepID=A0ABS8V9D6_DATST|nr:hypothetical protein [Datura stramonium]
MENTIEVVLEKVISTDSGVQELRSELLDLTTIVKNDDVAIQQLKDRMNMLALQVPVQQVTKETKVSPPQPNMDEQTFGWEMEEEILEETFSSLFLRGEEWEEVKGGQGVTDASEAEHRCKSAGCRPSTEDKAVHGIIWEAIGDSSAQAIDMPPVSTSVPGSNRHIGVSPGEMSVSIRMTLKDVSLSVIRSRTLGNHVELPTRSLLPTASETTSWHFDAATCSWGSRPNN